MTGRERVYATLDFQGPDRLPTDFWPLPATFFGREEAVRALLQRYPTDIGGLPVENVFDVPCREQGIYLDRFGCEWIAIQDGIVGEVKHPSLTSYDGMQNYPWPVIDDAAWAHLPAWIADHHDRFLLGGAGDPFERMQFLRGPENLYVDLADEECEGIYELRDRIFGYVRQNVERLVTLDIDGISFSDDWGAQWNLLISPAKWREFFKPKYQEVFDIVLDAGKRIFFHSDGYILDIYPDLIEMGVSALNSQVWCMGLDKLAPYAGKITFWGELDRQQMLPFGTPEGIRQSARQMVDTLYRHGGLIGQSSVDNVSPLENLEAALAAWGEITL